MRKQLFSLAILLLAGLGLAHGQTSNYDFSAVSPSGDTLYYKINPGGTTVSVVAPNFINYEYCDWNGYTCPTDTLLIPASVSNGLTSYSVTSIGVCAFNACTSLSSVTIPNSITTIGDYAFFGCTSLASVVIPDSVISIGYFAFSFVRHIVYYGLATGAPWGAISMNAFVDGGFVYADSTRTSLLAYIGNSPVVTIPNSVTSIGDYTFRGCTSLASVTIPSSVTSIGYGAFENCTSLASMTIPNSVTSIGGSTFYGCTSLASVTIPNSVTLIGASTFHGCTSLASMTIPNSVTSIGDFAFFGTSLSSVTIPNSVTSIGHCAFQACTFLTSVTIPGPITSIGVGTFMHCINLTSVTISNSVSSIGEEAFSNCKSLTSVTIPDSVTSIGDHAFSDCIGLSSVTIPDSVTSIGYGAFQNVRHIVYHGTATGAPWGAFYMNDMNGFVDGDFVYADSTRTTLLAYLGDSPNVTIPSSVTSIGDVAFHYCTNLSSVTIPNSVFSIGSYAFNGCTGLDTINCYCDVAPSLGVGAFRNVSQSAVVNIPCGSWSSYYVAWLYFYNFVEMPFADTIIVQTSDSTMGTATVTTMPGCDNGRTAIIKAVANEGFRFIMWSDSVADNPRTLVVSHDTMLTALFDTLYVALTLSANNPDWGTVDGGGEYAYGTEVTITATANEGYLFSGWIDGNEENPRTIVLREDMQLTANFAEGVGIHGTEGGAVRLFPNPTNGLLSVEGEGVSLVEVYDIASRRVLAAEGAGSIDLTALPDGVYYVRVVHGRGVTVDKVVKR